MKVKLYTPNKENRKDVDISWWAFRDLNPRPSGYEPDALTN